MSRGWPGESRRHALAARGISFRANAVFRPYRPTGPIDYGEPEEVFKAFWKASLEDDWSDFDFKKAFEEALPLFREELAQHGALGGEEFLRYAIDRYADNESTFTEIMASMPSTGEHPENEILELLEPDDSLKLIAVLEDDDYDAIGRDLMIRIADAATDVIWDTFHTYPEFRNMLKIYEVLQNPPSRLSEKIALYDSIIDTQHRSGSIWEYKSVDVTRLRREFQEQYGRFSP